MAEKTFAGQAAVVTGAGVGIGFEIARGLALRGASVLLNDVDTHLAEQAAASIRAEGAACHSAGGDVGSVEVVRGLVEKTVELFGGIHIAVANAGLPEWGGFFDYTPEKFMRVVSVNLGGSFFLAQAAARHMREQKTGGRILLMSSNVGHQGIRNLSAYAMTKAALEMLARALVLELSAYGITINCLAPGATVTPRNLADDPNYAQAWSRVIPIGRAATPQDIAEAALFLLSPSARQITGQTLIVDGGWTAVSPTPPMEFADKK